MKDLCAPRFCRNANCTRLPHLEATVATRSIIDTFIESLCAAERGSDLKELVSLFKTNAECVSLTGNISRPCEPRAFWNRYLGAFDKIDSHFTNVVDNGQIAVLEWNSSGTLPNGTPIKYSGVSILEYSQDGISKFRTYYDTAALLPYAERSGKHYSESVGVPDVSVEISS